MSINRVVLMGRITQDLEVRQTPNGVSTLTFNIAVDRNFKDQNGEYQSDFITCVAWRQTAEFIGKYFGKGRMIAVEGQLRSRTYEDKNGTKHYVTEVYVDNASFTGEKKSSQSDADTSWNNYSGEPQGAQQPSQPAKNGGFFAGTEQPPNAKNNNMLGDLSDFEEILDDGGVPF